MLKAGDLALRRAVPGDFESVVAIQRAAYARNRELLGVEPLPLLATTSRSSATLRYG